jgi:hypothetical protein
MTLEVPRNDPPGADEVEVNLFGPGTGESCVIHLGNGDWFVVDSCRLSSPSREPAGLKYLDALDVEVEKALVGILATHWDDDHIQGLAALFSKAKSAKFYLSSAIRLPELAAFVSKRKTPSRFSSGADELAHINEISTAPDRIAEQPLNPITASMRIWHSPSHPVREIWTLSPSGAETILAWNHIGSEILRAQNSPGFTRLSALDPNDTSVVLLLVTHSGSILLGADLETHKSRGRGWLAVVELSGPPVILSELFKVPHHGSKDADCPEIWDKRLVASPICIVAPFGKGASPPPQPADIERLKSRADKVYITSVRRDKARKRDRTTEKTIHEATRSYVSDMRCGHLQLRLRADRWEIRGSVEAAML